MSRKLTKWLVLSLVCGASLIQFSGCLASLAQLPLEILGMLVLDQVLGPVLGDPAGDLNPSLLDLFSPSTDG